MADDSSSQIFDPRKYLNRYYSYLNKPGEEPELLEFIMIKLHEYLKEGNTEWMYAWNTVLKIYTLMFNTAKH